VHIEPKQCFIGAGIWHPDSSALAKIRQRIASSGDAWRKASTGKPFTDYFSLGGSSLARPPKGFAADAPNIEDLKRKDFIAVCQLPDSAAVGADFQKIVTDRFKRAKPLVKFLCGALELAY
jgi:uncharacterized protein (TIGR02453 family)